MSFKDAGREELDGYPWLSGPNSQAMFSAFGTAQDSAMDELRDAIRMRDPALAPVDALPYIGRDRVVLKAPVEYMGDFRARLVTAPDDWYWGGASKGFLRFVFGPYGFTESTCQVLSNHEVGGAWDGNEDWHSRVFFFLDSRSGPFTFDGHWSEDPGIGGEIWQEDESDTGPTWDSSATLGDLRFFRASIRLTKADDAYPVTIAVWLDTTQMPDGYWDSPGFYDDGGVWSEDAGSPLYWTLGHVWGEEAWMGDGPDTEVWEDGTSDEMTDLDEEDKWIAFKGEED